MGSKLGYVAELIKKTWIPDQTYGLSRRDRRSCTYEAYLPDPIAGRAFSFDGAVAADIADAERAVVWLNQGGSKLADTEGVARLLLRAEAVASSRIEGLEVGGRRLFKAQFARLTGIDESDRGATEILNNIDAMGWAVEVASAGEDIGPDHLCQIHGRLMKGTSAEGLSGTFRAAQNWIGGSEFNPCSADFIPPPPEAVPELIRDLCEFVNGDDLPAVAQAAIVHSQFETIHPFFDGNGRTGRALIHMVLRRRGLAPKVVPLISLVLATRSRDYARGLGATRYVGDPDSGEATRGMSEWLGTFAAAATRSVSDAEAYDGRVDEIQIRWRSALGRVRRDSAVDRLIEALPGAPVITAKTAAALIGRTEQSTNQAIHRMDAAGVLSQTTVGRRNRAFEATDLIDAFNVLERQLASPEGDTRNSEPVRPVPVRR